MLQQSRHNIQVPGVDLFGVAARLELGTRLPEWPEHSRESVEQELATLDFLETQIESAEQRLEAIMKVSVEADVLKTLPCVGKILSMVLILHRHSGPDLADRSILLDNARRNPASGSRVGAEI